MTTNKPAPGVVGQQIEDGLRAIGEQFGHKFWKTGEEGCPNEIKAQNGELFKLRCKKCGLDNPRSKWCNISDRMETEYAQLASESRGGAALLARMVEQRDLAEAKCDALEKACATGWGEPTLIDQLRVENTDLRERAGRYKTECAALKAELARMTKQCELAENSYEDILHQCVVNVEELQESQDYARAEHLQREKLETVCGTALRALHLANNILGAWVCRHPEDVSEGHDKVRIEICDAIDTINLSSLKDEK